MLGRGRSQAEASRGRAPGEENAACVHAVLLDSGVPLAFLVVQRKKARLRQEMGLSWPRLLRG
jgi:hypothetical protein